MGQFSFFDVPVCWNCGEEDDRGTKTLPPTLAALQIHWQPYNQICIRLARSGGRVLCTLSDVFTRIGHPIRSEFDKRKETVMRQPTGDKENSSSNTGTQAPGELRTEIAWA